MRQRHTRRLSQAETKFNPRGRYKINIICRNRFAVNRIVYNSTDIREFRNYQIIKNMSL